MYQYEKIRLNSTAKRENFNVIEVEKQNITDVQSLYSSARIIKRNDLIKRKTICNYVISEEQQSLFQNIMNYQNEISA